MSLSQYVFASERYDVLQAGSRTSVLPWICRRWWSVVSVSDTSFDFNQYIKLLIPIYFKSWYCGKWLFLIIYSLFSLQLSFEAIVTLNRRGTSMRMHKPWLIWSLPMLSLVRFMGIRKNLMILKSKIVTSIFRDSC